MKPWFDSLRQALREIRSNAFRGALTVLGVALGVAALVAMLGVMESMLSTMESVNAAGGGMTKIAVTPQALPAEQAHLKNVSAGRTLRDVEALRRHATLIEHISAAVNLDWMPVSQATFTDWAMIQGATPEIRYLYNLDLGDGRFLGNVDVDHFAPVCVLGASIAGQIFPPGQKIVGQKVRIGSSAFTIVGVLKPSYSRQAGRNALWRRNWTVWIPITTAQKRFTGSRKVDLLEMQAVTLTAMVTAMEQVESILRPVHRWVRDFKVDNQLATMQNFTRQQARLRASLGGVAALSLVIGAIGILSIMLAGVNDRIREIGVRRALGAQQSDIFLQFLSEAALLSALGGLAGMAGGTLLVHALGRIMVQQPPVLVPWALAVGVAASVATGLIAGLYPACRAASLDPIEALRTE